MNEVAAAPVGDYRLPPRHPLRILQIAGAILGLAGAGLSGLVYTTDPVAFFRAYLVVFLYMLGLALGPIGILGLQYITGGRWGVVLRRPLEAAAATLPLMALLFVPIVLGMHHLYEWTHADVVAHDALLQKKAGYLNESFFLVRAALYFITWTVAAYLLRRYSQQQDSSPGPELERKLQFMGRGVLVIYALTMTFAAVDWGMSIDPHWFSHIYGVRMIGGQILTAFAFAVVVTVVLERRGPLGAIIGPSLFHDLGNLMLAFVMLWAYFELSQFLIIWSGNLPEETPYYLRRLGDAWRLFSIALIAVHFVVPFLVLLARPVKRAPARLAAVALLLLVARGADVYWQIMPSFQAESLVPHWVLGTLLAGMGGIWLVIYVWQLGAHPLLPISDTSLLSKD